MVRIQKLTEDGLEIFQHGRVFGKVHSVYGRVMNIMVGGNLFALHPGTIGWTPMSMALEMGETDFGFIHAKKDTQVVAESSGLCIGGQFFSIKGAEILKSTLTIADDGQNAEKTNRLYQAAIGYLRHTDDRGGFSGAATGREDEIDFTGKYLREIYSDFVRAIEEKKEDKLDCKIHKFIGVGNGLTPSGDDFLVGFLFVLFLNHNLPKALFERLIHEVKINIYRTTDLSGTFLQYACQGKFGEYLLELGNSLANESGITEWIEKIGALGHSSGIDTLTGITAGCLLAKKANER